MMYRYGLRRAPVVGCGRAFSLSLILILSCAASVQTHVAHGSGAWRLREQATSELSVEKVLANVRGAINYERVGRLRRGFVVEEFGVDEKGAAQEGARISTFGAGGAFREDSKPTNARPFGFDGSYGWQVDRTGLAAPVPQRLREKLLIPAWVRGGWWLDARAPLVFSILPEETNDARVALSMRLRRGLVGAKVYVNRATWLPDSLVVEYERGPYTVTYKDYRDSLGLRFPQSVVVNYRGSDSEYRVRSVAEANGGNVFAAPPLPPDTSFDNTLPAELKVAQGVPFSGGSPGHYYVRPIVDGREIGWFNFDTGSDAMHIDTKFADELKMPVLGKSQTRGSDGKVQEVTIRQGKTLQLGRVTFKNPLYLAMDLSARNAPPGEKRAGQVGHPLLARVVMEVTGGGKKMALYDPASYKLGRGKWQQLSYIDLTPAVVCRFEGNREGLFQLDTGYTGTVTFYDKFIEDEKLLAGRATKDETETGSGGTYKLLTGNIEWFELAGVRFKNPKAGFRVVGLSREGGAGVVGREFLSSLTIVFNYPERRIAFIR
ncbi:MAG TPA: aspartyl protease family protein [Pyrinomonadaceae bacterium]|nr:aspartyl protease family protein [Pyrinomonadaceae bacterium]